MGVLDPLEDPPLEKQRLSTYSSTVKQPGRHADPLDKARGTTGWAGPHRMGGATQVVFGGREGVNGGTSAWQQDGQGHLLRHVSSSHGDTDNQ